MKRSEERKSPLLDNIRPERRISAFATALPKPLARAGGTDGAPPLRPRGAAGSVAVRNRESGGEAMSIVHVVAVISAKPGMRGRILEAFQANVPAVKAEDGCIEYTAAVDADGVGPLQAKFGGDTFVVVEKWASLDALKAHAAAPHMKAYAAKTKDMIAERKIHVLTAA